MKSLLIMTALTISISANATSTALVTLKMNSGFSPRPQSVQLTISDDGSVVKTIHTQREVTKETFAKLSANSISSIKDKIEKIDDNAKLIDPNPKAPKCTDAPSSSVAVNKGGKEITVKTRASCHTSQVESLEAEQLIDLVTVFNTL